MWLILLVVLPILALLMLGLTLWAIIFVAISVLAYLLPVLLILAGLWLVARALNGSDHQRRARASRRARR